MSEGTVSDPGDQGGVSSGRGTGPPLHLWTRVVVARAGLRGPSAMLKNSGAVARTARVDELAARRSASSPSPAGSALPHVPTFRKAEIVGVMQDTVAQKNDAPSPGPSVN